jgi:hypothetical protein
MSIAVAIPRTRCKGCRRSGSLYEDKYGHVWCVECERWNGRGRHAEEQPMLDIVPAWPGDPHARPW